MHVQRVPRHGPRRSPSTAPSASSLRPELGPPVEAAGRRVAAPQVERVAAVFREAPPDALRLVALHHHLLGAPWRTAKRTIAHRSRCSAGWSTRRRGDRLRPRPPERDRRAARVRGGRRASRSHGTTVITAPGLGQPRPDRRGEARGLHVIEAAPGSLRVVTYAWATGPSLGRGLAGDRRPPLSPRPGAARANFRRRGLATGIGGRREGSCRASS